MSVDPRDTVDNPGTDPNRGMRTRPYMLTVILALVLLLIALLLAVLHRRSTVTPPTSPGVPATGYVVPQPRTLAA